MTQSIFTTLAALVELPDSVMYGVAAATYAVFRIPLEAFDSVLHAVFPGVLKTVDDWAVGPTQSPIAAKMPLLSSPTYVLFCLVAYFAALGALYAVGRFTGPLKVKLLSNVHNMFLFFLSLYMNVSILITALASGYSLWNNPVGQEADPNTWRMAKLVWLFYVSKLPEFVDTFIMMLKHNYRQVSFLHLYHHSTIFAIWYIVVSRAPGGESYFSAMLNSGVHVVMYGYYWLTAVFPEGPVRSFLNKIKFYITKLQMLQFFLNCCQSTYDLWLVPERLYPSYLIHLLLWYMCTLLALFGNFLIQNSGGSGKSKKEGGSKAASSPVAAKPSAETNDGVGARPTREPSMAYGKKKQS